MRIHRLNSRYTRWQWRLDKIDRVIDSRVGIAWTGRLCFSLLLAVLIRVVVGQSG